MPMLSQEPLFFFGSWSTRALPSDLKEWHPVRVAIALARVPA